MSWAMFRPDRRAGGQMRRADGGPSDGAVCVAGEGGRPCASAPWGDAYGRGTTARTKHWSRG